MSDWIKMRPGMRSHAKVTAMTRCLLADAEFCAHVFDTVSPVTSRVTFDFVTRVTVASLLDVWGAINHVVKSDNRVPFMRADDVDRIAGFPGFARAMQAVEWLGIEYDESLVFPNFGEFNTPESERKKPKTQSERSREYRARQKTADAPSGDRHERHETSRGTEQSRTDKQLCPDARAHEDAVTVDPDDAAADAHRAEQAQQRHAVPTGQALTFGEIITVLDAHGMPYHYATGGRGRDCVLAWATAGVETADLTTALARAHENKRDGPIGPAYLDPIVKQVIAERRNPGTARGHHAANHSGHHGNRAARATASLLAIAQGDE
jgi:hypothetical protein